MCGRYVLSLRPSQVRHRLADQNMPADEAPPDSDDRIRQSYNFAPGYHGLIYRAHTSDRGASESHAEHEDIGEPSPKKAKLSHTTEAAGETTYKLQAAKWGLIPFWTKRSPDYGSMLRTINCRDDSLMENRGMWNTMKQRKRCVVVAEGFYEWLKKNGGRERIPHYTRRKDGQLLCFAGLWDCVQYEDGPGSDEKLYTYTIITTDSNAQLKFLHDRMPVILEPGSAEMKAWLDPHRVGWDKELQSMLKPFRGELECYPVDQAVGKVGNNSPSFVVPIDSKENKKNIANFFGNQAGKNGSPKKQERVKKEEQDEDEQRDTATKVHDPESNAPLPKPAGASDEQLSQEIKKEAEDLDDQTMIQATDEAVENSIKQEVEELDDQSMIKAADEGVNRGIKREIDEVSDEEMLKAETSPPTKVAKMMSPVQKQPGKTRSATSNHTVAKTPTKEGNKRITAFFGK